MEDDEIRLKRLEQEMVLLEPLLEQLAFNLNGPAGYNTKGTVTLTAHLEEAYVHKLYDKLLRNYKI